MTRRYSVSTPNLVNYDADPSDGEGVVAGGSTSQVTYADSGDTGIGIGWLRPPFAAEVFALLVLALATDGDADAVQSDIVVTLEGHRSRSSEGDTPGWNELACIEIGSWTTAGDDAALVDRPIGIFPVPDEIQQVRARVTRGGFDVAENDVLAGVQLYGYRR